MTRGKTLSRVGGPSTDAWLRCWRTPQDAAGWSSAEWEAVIWLGRRLRLLAPLAHRLDDAGLMPAVPSAAARHLRSDMQASRWRTQSLCWVLERVATAWADAPYPRVLLKGAAYVAQGSTIGKGRLPSDVDVLVPRSHLADAQARLATVGWSEVALDAHDQRYYREWSHEAPPLRHQMHTLELDLHHNILPPVARTAVDASKLFERIQPSPLPGWHVLHPVDQILHSAAHLFLDSDLSDRLRDLVDLDELLRVRSADPGFWDDLTARARELGLGEPLALACHFTHAWFGTPIPAATLADVGAMGPGPVQRAWWIPALTHVLSPTEPDSKHSLRRRMGAKVLLVRYHLTRMPLRLLVRHLSVKALRSIRKDTSAG